MNQNERYIRQVALEGFGVEGQAKLAQAKVLVIGAGGLGCPILQYLAAAGVGHITVVDPDVVSPSNLHRQILFDEADIGAPKAERAAENLLRHNPNVSVTPIQGAFDSSNAIQLVSRHDVVVDGSDNFSTRYLASDATTITKTPLVFGALSKFTGQVSVFNYKEGPTYRCLFPEAPVDMPTCEEEGVLGVVPGIVGSLMAAEAVKVISDCGQPLSGQLLSVDIRTNQYRTLKFSTNPENLSRQSLEDNYQIDCSLSEVDEVAWADLVDQYLLVDIRGEAEPPLAESVHTPDFDKLVNLCHHSDRTPALVCHTGLSSKAWSQRLALKGVHSLVVSGGMASRADLINRNSS